MLGGGVDGKGACGLVIRSAKKAGFAAGADIREFADLGMPDQAGEQLKRAHAVDRPARTGWISRRLPSFTAIAWAAGSNWRSHATTGWRSTRAKLGFPESHAGPPSGARRNLPP